jgi:hypothetical protein
MTKLTFQIEKQEDLDLLLSLAERLHIPYSQSDEQAAPTDSVAERAIQYILSCQNDQPSFGDALEWQRQGRK